MEQPRSPESRILGKTFDDAPYPQAILDSGGRVARASRAFREWFGDECVGRSVEETVGGTSAGLERMLLAVCSERRSFHVKDILLRLDARSVRVEAYGRSLDEEGKSLVVFHDLTDCVSASTSIAQRERSESIARFSGGLAHDLNNMLAAIVATAQAGRADARERVGDASADFSAIIDEAQRGASLARSLHAIAFDATGSWRPVDLGAELRAVAAVLGRGSAAIPIVLDIDDTTAGVVGDRARLHQLVLNLLVNARDAARLVGGGIEVSLGPTASGGVRLVVADSGPGIPAELRERVFQPYFTTKGKRLESNGGWGVGLGLTIVDAVARSTDASLRVDDRPGGGTLFTVEWPPTAAMEPSDREVVRVERAVSPALILLADDEAALVGAVARQLRRTGHSVYVAMSAGECRRLFDEYRSSVDVAVIDVMLGDGDGRRLAERFRKARPDVGIVLISATKASTVAGSAAPDGILIKPFDVADLAEAIERAREAARAQGSASTP